jgi:PKD domain
VRKLHRSANCRPGIAPGRRSALILAVIAGLLTGPAGPALAGDSSSPLVVATVYSSNGTSTDSVSAAALETDPQQCPNYSGPNTMNEYGLQGAVPVQLSGTATWALSTLLGCLPSPIPVDAVNGVTVLNDDGSPEEDAGAQLTRADLTSPSDFNNPAEQPVVQALGSRNEYDRPWRGSPGGQQDHDFLDEVLASQGDQPSPITIEVFEGPLLTVTADASQTRVPVGGTVSFSASATGQNDSGLSYSWNFADGAPNSTAAAPQVQFNATGTYDVTVQVTDTAGGGGGAAVPISVGTTPPPASGSQTQRGAGGSGTSHSPTGPGKSGGTHPGGKPGKASSGHSTTGPDNATGSGTSNTGGHNASAGRTTTSGATTPTTASTTAAAPTTHYPSSTASRSTGTARVAQPAEPRLKSSARTLPTSPLVTGRLVSDVTPLPAGASPLVHDVTGPPTTAPPARRAIRASSLPGLAAGLAVAVLLGLGAGRELRGRRGWRALRLSG